MRRTTAVILGLALAANGLAMLAAPARWCADVPGATETGPLGLHFVRDVGVAYLVAGAAIAGCAIDRSLAAAEAAAAFSALHAGIHLWDVVAGREPAGQLAVDLPTVFLPPALAIWIVWGAIVERMTAMLKWFLHRRTAAFERQWAYDAAYAHDLIDADPRALLAFGKAQAISRYRKDAPPAAYCAAGLVAAMAEDCGPCTQLGIDMAERSGVDPAVLNAIVARDFTAMPEEAVLAMRFAEATLHHAPEADELREEIVRQFGRRGLASLAFAMLSGRMYPTLKYALGHGRACAKLTIGGQTRPVTRGVQPHARAVSAA